ncbi:apolipoprotein B-100 [Trichonephila clavipes]|nr:apolipoprotein B-100 [Trichonephila clavipes]
MIPAYNRKRCAAVPFETGIHLRRKTDFFPEEDTTKSYSGFEPTRLQAEGHSYHTGWVTLVQVKTVKPEDSVRAIGWISHYFDLAVGFFKSETSIIETVLKRFILDNKEFRWEFITGRVLKMESFREWPSLAFELNPFTDENQESDQNGSPSPDLDNAIAAFGRRSVLTFDGREYEMEEFASECIFLLARDLFTSSFTVLGGKKKIQILLPEVTVRINDNNQVFVNGNRVPAELSLKTSVGEVVVKRTEAAVGVHSPFLKVFCRAEDFLCTLQLRSPEIMGLLSATDMSSYKKFSLHEKDIASEWMSSYEVSGKTECENLRFRSIHPYLNEIEASYSRPFSHFARTLPKQFPDVCKYESTGGTDSHFSSEDFPPYSLRNEKSSMYGDRFNSCQVIYSQFGLAIHQNDHQARRKFVEWAQNEIAVVPDFHKRILFSDEAHFWLNGYVNKQNCRIWSEANPQVYVETPLHPEKLTVWCALWAGGILLQKR